MGVIWITGLAGAGKSSIAAEVMRQLRAQSVACILLDGDAVRAALGDSGYERGDRLAAAHRIAALARLIAAQGIHVIVATVSLFHDVHASNRTMDVAYMEVLVRCAEPLLRRRSPLYTQHDGDHVVGRGIAAEFPYAPHLVVDNDAGIERLSELAGQIVKGWMDHVRIR